MSDSLQEKTFVSPPSACDATPEGRQKCCISVIETYTSAEFSRTEIVNVEEHCSTADPEHPEATAESFTGRQDVG